MLTTPARPNPGRDPVAARPDPDAAVRHPGSPRRQAARPVRIEIRQRRAMLVLGALVVALVVAAAASGAASLWLAALCAAGLGAGYGALVVRVRRLSAEREMSTAFAADPDVDWDAFGRSLSAVKLASEREGTEPAPPVTVEMANLDLVRFVAAWALGMVLTPVVGLLRIAHGDLSDLERHGVIDKLVRAQSYGRSQSLKVVAAGLVATAGVATVGAVAVGGTAGAAPAVAAAVPGTQYTVQAGDTLGAVAARFGVSLSSLASDNSISDVNLIFPGQVLTIPAGGSSSSAASGSSGTGSYTVQAGDTLGSIASRFGTTVTALTAANHLSDPNLILVGEQLVVGGSGSTSASTTGEGLDASGAYTVQAGDTLGSIASRFGTTVADLSALNDLSDPNLITVGETLQVTGTATADTSTSTSGASGSTSSGSTSSGSTSSGSGTSAPASSPAPAPAGGESEAAAIAVKVALEQVGKPYVYGGAGPDSFDCSGLVMYAYAAAGISLPHYSVSQYEDTTRVSEADLLPGDLVFYDNYDGPQPGHVAMYIGGGQVVAANETGTNVQTQSLSWDGTIIGFGRVS